MTMKRETKTQVQRAATSTEPVRAASPRQRSIFGAILPLKVGRKFAAEVARPTRTAGRTRESVASAKLSARRSATRH